MANHFAGKLKSVLEILSSIAAIGAVIIVAMTAWSMNSRGESATTGVPKEPVLPKAAFSLDPAQSKGSPTARVALIAFSDFECPVCSRFTTTLLPTIEAEYVTTGKVVFSFHHRPLESLHQHAFDAALASACAGKQGKFWQMHDVMFANPKRLDRKGLIDSAKVIGLNGAKFIQCLNEQPENRDGVRKQADAADALEIQSTPTFFVADIVGPNSVKVRSRIDGMPPLKGLKSALDAALTASGSR
jgi:protein-disulfide isomerase